MRTKALILTAAVGAMSVAASMAQVYSVNAVGYVNLSVPAGKLAMIANQLSSGNTNVAQLIPIAPNGTTVYSLNPNGTFRIGQFLDLGPGLQFWDDPDVPLTLGGGLFVSVPAGGSALNVTFVGEVPQGNLVNPIPVGLSMKSSIVPQEGLVTAVLNYQPTGGDTIQQYDTQTGLFVTSQFLDLGPGLQFWDNEPNIKVGESFYIQTGTAKNWTRTFTVN
jgi:hypothetical protein